MRPWLAVTPPLPGSMIPAGGQDWNQAQVVRGVDGDTVRLLRRRVTATEVERDDQGALVCTDYRVRVLEDDVAEFPGGLAGRLINLDTPELHSKDLAERAQARLAADDLAAWCQLVGDRLRVVVYDTGGGFDRMLVDLYWIDAAGDHHSATEHMLLGGWPPYVRGA